MSYPVSIIIGICVGGVFSDNYTKENKKNYRIKYLLFQKI